MNCRKIGRYSIAITISLLNGISLFAQDLVATDLIRAKYKDANTIYLKRRYEYVIGINKDQLTGVCNIEEQRLVNKETGIGHNSKQIYVDAFMDAHHIEARTLIPDGKKYKPKKVEKIELEGNVNGEAFYDDSKAYKFTFPYSQVGAIFDLKYQMTYKELRFMGIHYWSDYTPIASNELVIRFPKNVSIGYKCINCQNADITFTQEEKNGEIIYKWKRLNANAVRSEDNSPSFRYYEPHIIFYIKDYEVKGKNNHLLGTTKDLYLWYNSLLKNLNKTEDAELKRLTDSLTAGITDEKEKVRKIFYWVQDNISYVAFEDGLGGFIPRDAGVVCYRKFGDCKDMSSIICEMLKFAGIKAYHTWIGSRDIPYGYDEIPTPFVDNHMIASYQDKDGKWIFLDGVGKKAPMDLYTSMIQGKQALIGISKDSFLVVTVPIKDTSVSQIVDSVTVEIKNKTVEGLGNASLSGYYGLYFLYRTERLNKDEYQDYFRAYFAKGTNKVTFHEISKPESTREKLKLSYKFKLDDYARFNQNEIYINLNLDKSELSTPLAEDRNTQLSYTFKGKQTYVTTLVIPDGYVPSFIPADKKYGNEKAGFISTYRIEGNKIIHTYSYYINFILLQVEDFKLYNDVADEQMIVNKQTVSLIKK